MPAAAPVANPRRPGDPLEVRREGIGPIAARQAVATPTPDRGAAFTYGD